MRKSLLQLAIVLLAVTKFCTAQPATVFNASSPAAINNAAFSDAWSFALAAGAAFPTQKGEAGLFMHTGVASKFSGQYFFGKTGVGFSGGMVRATMDNTAITSFMQANKFPDNTTFSTAPSLTSYWLVGPSFRMGSRIKILGELRGGIFQNKAGSLSINAPGVTRPLYRFEAGEKTTFPGWSGSLSIAYPLGATTAISISTDYLHSSSEIRLYDPRQGIDVATTQTKKWQVFTAGFSFIKSFGGKQTENRSRQRGMPTGKRSAVQSPNNVHEIADDVSVINPDANRTLKTRTKSNQTNERTINTYDDAGIMNSEANRVLKTKTKSNQSNDRLSNENCGPVTTRIMSPDGTVNEMIFSCPDDALAYAQKMGDEPAQISKKTTTPKQTQGATFGEKVNQGLHAAGSALAQGAALQPSNTVDAGNKNILFGRIVHSNNGEGGSNEIVTSKIAGGGGGAAQASYAATGMVVAPQPPTVLAGPVLNIYARDAGSGMASGRRARDAGSGMASGRRTYQPIFTNDAAVNDGCAGCNVKASNPLFNENANAANNPMHQKSAGNVGPDDDCDGLAEGFAVSLIDVQSNTVVAKTKTDRCGNYWFANLPTSAYAVQVEGYVAANKKIPITISGKEAKDIAGVALAPDAQWQHTIYQTNNASSGGVGKVSVQDISLIAADADGDGWAETFRTIGNQSDGSSKDFTAASAAKSSGGGAGKASMSDLHFAMPAAAKSGGAGKASLSDLHFTKPAGSNQYKAVATFADGSTQDISRFIDVQQHAGLLQITSKLADTDGDGAADLIWSPRSNVSVSSRSATVSNTELPAITFESTRAFTDALQTNVGDLDGDGIPEIIAGNNGAALLGGALPGGAVISAAVGAGNPQSPIVVTSRNNDESDDGPSNKPGTPIGGIIVKGGKNPGGNLFAKSLTNNLGEFEMKGLEPGENFLLIQSNYVVSDTKFIEWRDDDSDGDGYALYKDGPKVTASQNTQSLRVSNAAKARAQDHNSSRSNKTASAIDNDGDNSGGTKAQDHNSSRSNKTASTIDNDGGENSGGTKSQDHNSSRSNKSGIVAGGGNGGNDATARNVAVKVTASQNSQSLRIVAADADLDGDGIFETDVTNKVYDDIVVNEKGETTTPTQRAGISTSRSNIRNRSSLQEVSDGVYIGSGSTTIGDKAVPIKMVYKRRVGGIFKGD